MKNLPSQLVFVLRRVEPPVLLIRGVSPPAAASHCPPSYQQFLLQLCFSVKDCGPAEPQRRTPARRTHVNIMKIREGSCQKYSTGRRRQTTTSVTADNYTTQSLCGKASWGSCCSFKGESTAVSIINNNNNNNDSCYPATHCLLEVDLLGSDVGQQCWSCTQLQHHNNTECCVEHRVLTGGGGGDSSTAWMEKINNSSRNEKSVLLLFFSVLHSTVNGATDWTKKRCFAAMTSQTGWTTEHWQSFHNADTNI